MDPNEEARTCLVGPDLGILRRSRVPGAWPQETADSEAANVALQSDWEVGTKQEGGGRRGLAELGDSQRQFKDTACPSRGTFSLRVDRASIPLLQAQLSMPPLQLIPFPL